ncbi:hypothetical protein MKK69_01600 [Methylobacterium sp. J-026]|uniref:hypothetical protein n=1 Tax=Methylobacterium sp. J-026 TaxID=2836624 RepID=UPI001FBBA44D|nr:hypothetical protein [Methylobacterium sp. J-026]MCJ2132770.1 hypothetical protein [Methylobacterium sp. J-026]
MDITEDDFIFVFPTTDGHTSVLNPYFGTNLADLTECTAPDVQIMPEYLLAYWWNHIIQQVDDGPGRAAVVLIGTFIRNIGPAVFDYRAACRYVRRYLSHLPNGTAPMAYDLAVARFESCILRIGVAIACVNGATKIYPPLPPAFTKGDGSVSERVHLFNNRIKHFGSDIANAADPGAMPTASIWITNNGLGCHHKGKDVFVSFVELAALLQDLSGEAEYRAENPLPAS